MIFKFQPTEGWVQFKTLKSGAKFHDIIGDGMPKQFIKTHVGQGASLDDGQLVAFDQEEYVYPIDAGWIAEIGCYCHLSEEMKQKTHQEILAYVFSQCDARKADQRWREEIEKYFPQLGVMSFSGAKSTIRWLMERVMPKEPHAQLANKLVAIEKSDVSDEEKCRLRLEAIFPNLKE